MSYHMESSTTTTTIKHNHHYVHNMLFPSSLLAYSHPEDSTSTCAILGDTDEDYIVPPDGGCDGVHFVRIPAFQVERRSPTSRDSELSHSLDQCPSDLYDGSAHLSQKGEEDILLEELDRGNDPDVLQSLLNDWQASDPLLTGARVEDPLSDQLVFGTVTIEVF
ncbi:hypothetical protein ASPACDRAFT_63376 [Aspergillus aculeatus ATCC 16872]|uniref:Uncharacterized protein n=1 Tax=Aspergillus aculeatus (strain ATCC 16872 / CBS 172.66 / WB 5094) TaxID=690307 RepID=A0A1L9WJW7_ASPA1|nr:uncharacterized protein ASPACDRAFT_63376 [Aspergillus aculeatus ATCC 16872]OJJ96446.1 hypothetical protein ASPACDRAFT_63376 [Aspergillus aculeatus ATCC 16872]